MAMYYGRIVVVGLSLVACTVADAGECSGRLQSGRVVSASSDTLWVTARNEPNTCTIALGMKKVVVESERVLLGERVIANVDKSTRQVAVIRKDAKLTVVADGKVVYCGGLK
jgi:hypothetical protein